MSAQEIMYVPAIDRWLNQDSNSGPSSTVTFGYRGLHFCFGTFMTYPFSAVTQLVGWRHAIWPVKISHWQFPNLLWETFGRPDSPRK